jgi:hypothetical protein
MKKTLLYRLFGIGKIPAAFDSLIQNEGSMLADEGFKGTVTYRNFRAPGRYSNWKRQWFTASIALTNTRLLAFQYSAPIIDVPFTDARFCQLNFSVENDGALLVAFDASLFHDDWSGTIEYRFFTPHAPEFLDQSLQKQAARHPTSGDS